MLDPDGVPTPLGDLLVSFYGLDDLNSYILESLETAQAPKAGLLNRLQEILLLGNESGKMYFDVGEIGVVEVFLDLIAQAGAFIFRSKTMYDRPACMHSARILAL